MTHRSIVCVSACHLLVSTAALAQDVSAGPPEGGFTGATERLTLNTQITAYAIDERGDLPPPALAAAPLDLSPVAKRVAGVGGSVEFQTTGQGACLRVRVPVREVTL